MIYGSLSEVEVLACFFVASAALILVGLRMIIGPSPQRHGEEEPSITSASPRSLAAVEEEGYEVIELYDDRRTLEDWLRGSKQRATPTLEGHAVRTAKVRNPESGQIILVRILDRAGRIH